MISIFYNYLLKVILRISKYLNRFYLYSVVDVLLCPVLSFLFVKIVRFQKSSGGISYCRKGLINGEDRRIKVLALSADYFRGTLEGLAAHPEFIIARIDREWQFRLLSIFFYNGVPGSLKFSNQEENETRSARNRYKEFLRKFLVRFYGHLHVDCVISANYRYQTDIDWGIVSRELKIPYIVIFRETGAMVSQNHPGYQFVKQRHEQLDKFDGDAIFVLNEISKEMFCEGGFASAQQVDIVGGPQFDIFIDKIKKNEFSPAIPKKVVLFPFSTNLALLEPEWAFEFFSEVHMAFIDLAIKLPDVEFIIKPKESESRKQWRRDFDKLSKKTGITLDSISNISIQPNANVCELILESSVVCGLNSTTLQESAIAGKPVVLTYFKEYRNSPKAGYITLNDNLDLFDVAHDGEELKKIVEHRLTHPSIDKTIINKRWDFFDRYVSSTQGSSSQRCAELIRKYSQQMNDNL